MAESAARKFSLAKVMPSEEVAIVPQPDGFLTRISKGIRRQPGDPKPIVEGNWTGFGPSSVVRDPVPLDTYIAMAGNVEKTPVTEFSQKFLRDMVRTSDVLSLIVRTKTSEAFRSGVSIEERFKSKCKSCGREYEEEKVVCPYDGSETVEPDYQQWKVLNEFMKTMNRFDESLMTTMREVDTDVHICDNGWLYLDRDYWFDDDGNISYEEVQSVIRMDSNMMRLIMSRYGMGTSETGTYSYFCVEHRTEVVQFPDKGEHKCKCGKVMIPAWYCALNRAERYFYGPREIYHVKLYSNAQGYGVPPLMACWMQVNTLLRMNKFILEAYSLQRAPQELLILRGKRDTIHRAWEWLMQKARENPNMVYPLVLEGDDGSKTRVVEHETFSLKPIEWQWTEMRQEYRTVIGAVYGVQPIFTSGAGMGGASGGLANEGLQIAVTGQAIKQEQHVWNVFLEFLSNQLGVTDYKLTLNPSEQEDEIRDLDVEQKRVQIAQAMIELGYSVELHQDAKGRMDFKFKERPPELNQMGPNGEELIPQEDANEKKDAPSRGSMSPEELAQSRWNEQRRMDEKPQPPREYQSIGMGLGDFQFEDDIEMVKVCDLCGGETEAPSNIEKSYSEYRWNTMRMIAGGDPHCDVDGCGADPKSLTIAHHKPDEFSGYASRSGGAAYSRWMGHVREHLNNYHLLCPKHHSEADNRIVPGPEVHRKDVQLLRALSGVKKANYKGRALSVKNPRGDEDVPVDNVQGEQGMAQTEAHTGGMG